MKYDAVAVNVRPADSAVRRKRGYQRKHVSVCAHTSFPIQLLTVCQMHRGNRPLHAAIAQQVFRVDVVVVAVMYSMHNNLIIFFFASLPESIIIFPFFSAFFVVAFHVSIYAFMQFTREGETHTKRKTK